MPTNPSQSTLILFCIAILILQLEKRIPLALPITAFVFSIGFIFFNIAYHGEDYQRRTSALFNEGIIPAIEFATEKSDSLICFTEQRYSLYIYVLLTQKYHVSRIFLLYVLYHAYLSRYG